MIPIWLNVTGKHVLVIGLGPVGQRRALLFQREGAVVIGVDPLPRIQGQEWGELIRNGLELQSQPYHVSIFDELAQIGIRPQLVLACANQAVNSQIVTDCRQKQIWVASSTSHEDSPADFQLGALGRGEAIAVAVHSEQGSPGLSATIRDEIGESLMPAADRLARLAKIWRPRILNEIDDPAERQRLIELFADRSILKSEIQQPGSGTELILTELQNASDLFRKNQ